MADSQPTHLVAVIGAGPAGLFAARELALNNVRVVIFNRDIKPGGLAEYGIYPDKHRMKEGLRAQFRQILGMPLIDYIGHLTVGAQADLSLEALRGLGFSAMLVSVGAQGTKKLGLPGEEARGVFHAKDLVYHYNSIAALQLARIRRGAAGGRGGRRQRDGRHHELAGAQAPSGRSSRHRAPRPGGGQVRPQGIRADRGQPRSDRAAGRDGACGSDNAERSARTPNRLMPFCSRRCPKPRPRFPRHACALNSLRHPAQSWPMTPGA